MGHVGRDRDQIEDETERNKHVFAVSLKDSAQEGRDRDRISNVGRDGTRVPPFKGGTRKLCSEPTEPSEKSTMFGANPCQFTQIFVLSISMTESF